jgi:DNA-binding transcriptional LysR family regulator
MCPIGRRLASYRHVVVTALEVAAAHRIDAPEDLRAAPCACWRTGRPSQWSLGDASVRFEPVVATNDYGHLLRLALCGDVITELPPFVAERPLAEGRLVPVLPKFPMPLQHVRALVRVTRSMSPLVRRFLNVMAEAVPQALGPPSS